MFQSLYRGTAIATVGFTIDVLDGIQSFNPSIEGQPLQPTGKQVKFVIYATEFQSLYRGTAIATMQCLLVFVEVLNRFNPSIEGQPLQLE